MKEGIGSSMNLFVLGLDGASFDIILPLVQQGKLPNIRRVIEEGSWGELQSTIPPLTAPAWISFLTGKNPGKHGVLSFRNLDATAYQCFRGGFVNSNSYHHATIFDILGQHNLRLAAVSVPLTYPAWPVNGLMISGYPVGDTKRAYYPPGLESEVKSNLFWPRNTHRMAVDELLQKVNDLLRLQVEFCLSLIREKRYDFIMVNIDNLDNAVHHFWHFHDPQSPVYSEDIVRRYGDLVENQYSLVDQYIGEILDIIPDDANLIVMSDHGAGRAPSNYFHTNAWLRSKGLLTAKENELTWRNRLSRLLPIVKENLPIKDQLRRFLPESIKTNLHKNILNIASIEWAQTSAYRVPLKPQFEGIEINLKGRQTHGVVHPGGEYEQLVSSLIESLEALVDPSAGQPIFANIYRREQLYSGPYLEKIPDIVAQFAEGYDGGTHIHGDLVTDIPMSLLRAWPGNHKLNGILIARGRAFRSGIQFHGANLVDLLPTILYLFDVPIPEDLDGRVVEDLFSSEFQRKTKRTEKISYQRATGSEQLTTDEEEEIINRLKGLGYM
jgi:predicted AlkP superfamily phosphohydrolase/phosphomutase